MTISVQDLDAARDAATSCLDSAFALKLNLVSGWRGAGLHRTKISYQSLDRFQQEAHSGFQQLDSIYERAKSSLSKGVLDALVMGSRDGPPAEHHGRSFSTWHELAVESAHEVLTIPLLETVQIRRPSVATRVAIDRLDSAIGGARWVPLLIEFFSAMESEERLVYWPSIVKALREWKGPDRECAKTWITREWANAVQARAQPKTDDANKQRRRPSKTRKPRPLTTNQVEAIQIVGECKGNVSQAAKRLRKDRKTVDEQYRAGLKKLGKSVVRSRDKTRLLPRDRRGQENLSEDDDRRG
jgi:predicted DNA-binding protein (UPF0251 family)